MSLAYVFWHWPARPGGYAERLQAFHAALGLPSSVTFRLARAPWAGADPEPFEDWYPVAGWAALGELNDRAVSGPRRAPHDAAAEAARTGTAGVVKRIVHGPPLHEVAFAAWLAKPAGTPYDAFDARLAEAAEASGAAVWQRQLVLGPAPEYAVLGTSPVALDGFDAVMLTEPRVVARGA